MGDIMVLAIGSIVGAIFRFISAMLDTVIYWALTCVYNLLSDIASVNLFGSDGAGEFATRIYTIIGVIMLFKLAFSILTYIIDPDKMTDNKNGFGTIVKDIVIMFVLIVTVPLIFRTAMGLQYLILEDDTIGRLVTGHHGGDYKSMGDRLSSNILMTFIHPNESYFPDCNGVMSKESENYQKCVDSLAPYSDVKAQFEQVYDDETFGRQHILRLGMMTNKVNGHSDEFVITYYIFLSTIVGGFAAYILLIFCIDIATRTIKMAFLQLIAPIPIVAYMDEKGKNGMFKKWVTVCRNTYADLFIRLAGIDFAIYLIAEFIFNNQAKICHWKLEGTTLSSFECRTPGPFVYLFMILGVLIFAKQLPNIIKEITGIDLNGKFTMNPLKKIQDEALFGKQVSSGLAFAGRTGKNLALAGGALATGLPSAMKYGLAGAKMNKNARWEGFKSNFAVGYEKTGAFSRATGSVSKIGADARGTIGDVLPFVKNKDDQKKMLLKQFADAEKSMEDRALEKIKAGAAGALSEKYTRMTEEINAARNRGDAAKAAEIQGKLNAWMNSNEATGAASQYIDFIMKGEFTNDAGKLLSGTDATKAIYYADGTSWNDGTMSGTMVSKLTNAATLAEVDMGADAAAMHKAFGNAKADIGKIEVKQMAAQQAKSGN